MCEAFIESIHNIGEKTTFISKWRYTCAQHEL